jgi:hypothetical protein
MNDEEIASYITAMQNQEQPAYQQDLDLDSLLGRSYAPSEEFMEWSQGGSPIPEIAEAKMNARERIEAMLALMRMNTEETANLYETDTKNERFMEQRYVDPRDYGADLPPNAPQVERSQAQRLNPHETKMRWLGQMIEHIESGTPTAPPQLTGRFRDRVAF